MADEAAAPTVEIPADLAARAKAAGWPDDLVLQALQAGAQPADLIRFMMMGISAEQAREYMAAQTEGAAAAGGQPQELTMEWMNVPTEWGTRALPTKKGLTIEAINVGRYGDVPDHWDFQSEMPRGAVAVLGVEAMGYSIYDKQELWSDIAGDLYEEAIQRRWRPSTDVPWDALTPLPEDLERAICQLCTHFSEKAQLEADVLSKWEPELSYGYHEVKLYLATTIFEGARHAEVFRKRALSNGGGLGLQSTGWGLRSIADARNFTELVLLQMVLHDSFTLTQYQFGERYAPTKAEQYIFRMGMQDKARHVAYGVTHLKYVLLNRPDRRKEVERYLEKGEAMLCDDDRDSATREAFAILFAGSMENIKQGLHTYEQMRKRQVEQYLARLKWATMERRTLWPALRKYVEEPA